LGTVYSFNFLSNTLMLTAAAAVAAVVCWQWTVALFCVLVSLLQQSGD
jgi:hypothetical protein